MRTHVISERIQARALIGFSGLVEAHGGEPAVLLSRCGIPFAALDSPELPIALDNLARLYDLAAEELKMPDFGLRLSAAQDLSIYGPLALIVLHSRTVGDALDLLVRHFAFHTPGATISIAQSDDPEFLHVSYALDVAPDIDGRQIVEQSYGMAAKLWATVAPARACDARILLRHAPAVAVSEYRERFACPCLFGQERDAILLPRDALGLAIDRADPELLAGAERYIANVIRDHPLDLGRQVEALIAGQMAFGGATIDNIARQMKMHRRRLQRRLAEQGLHFEDILDGLRRYRTQEYLREPNVSLGEIGAMLGYNEQSSFSRACRRWFGASPKRLRRMVDAPLRSLG